VPAKFSVAKSGNSATRTEKRSCSSFALARLPIEGENQIMAKPSWGSLEKLGYLIRQTWGVEPMEGPCCRSTMVNAGKMLLWKRPRPFRRVVPGFGPKAHEMTRIHHQAAEAVDGTSNEGSKRRSIGFKRHFPDFCSHESRGLLGLHTEHPGTMSDLVPSVEFGIVAGIGLPHFPDDL
jgi:hypothetical protein